MFKDTKAFSGFSVNDISRAKKFYSDILGIDVTEEHGLLTLHFSGGTKVLVYPKENHVPATFTILNFPVRDIEKTVRILASKGIKFEHYEGSDENGITYNSGPLIAWFKDPAGNFLAVIKDDLAYTGDSIQLTQFIPVESEKVFKAWSSPELLEKWAHPDHMKLVVQQFDFTVGGVFRFKYIGENGPIATYGIFKKIIPKEKVIYTVKVDGPDGSHRMDTLLIVDFQEKEWGTEVMVTQEGFTESESVRECEQGWHESLEKLRKLLVEKSSDSQPVQNDLRQ